VKKTVYIETSIISYLAALPSRDLIVAAHQQITQRWWERDRRRFEIYISTLVKEEAARGDANAATRRLSITGKLPVLKMKSTVVELAKTLIMRDALPAKAQDDAMHVAIAAIYGCDYLLTWNCRHIDNAENKPLVRLICNDEGYICPEICTPEELMEDDENER
jgi:hypothetical protein